jgi:hypothetical protein
MELHHERAGVLAICTIIEAWHGIASRAGVLGICIIIEAWHGIASRAGVYCYGSIERHLSGIERAF